MVFNENDIKIDTWKDFGKVRSIRITYIPTKISVFKEIGYKSNTPIIEIRNELFEELKKRVINKID